MLYNGVTKIFLLVVIPGRLGGSRNPKLGTTGIEYYNGSQAVVHYIFLISDLKNKKICLSSGLFPGTEYQISVQAIKGPTEGKPSSANGATGQCQHISIHQPFNLMCYSVTNVLL